MPGWLWTVGMCVYLCKDMEKWAKKLNAQKEQLKDVTKSVSAQPAVAEPVLQIQSTSASADAGFSLLEKVTWNSIELYQLFAISTGV